MGGVAHLGGEVLQDGSRVDGGGRADAALVGHAHLEVAVDTADRELQAGLGRTRDGLLRLELGSVTLDLRRHFPGSRGRRGSVCAPQTVCVHISASDSATVLCAQAPAPPLAPCSGGGAQGADHHYQVPDHLVPLPDGALGANASAWVASQSWAAAMVTAGVSWDDFRSILGSSGAPFWDVFWDKLQKIEEIRLLGCSWVSVECSRVDFTSILGHFGEICGQSGTHF